MSEPKATPILIRLRPIPSMRHRLALPITVVAGLFLAGALGWLALSQYHRGAQVAETYEMRLKKSDLPIDHRIGDKIESFELSSADGDVISLNDYADAKAIVVAFLGVECPLAQLYSRRLSELKAKYDSQGIVVLGIDSNLQDSRDDLKEFASEYELNFPLLHDAGNHVADMFAAVRTPEIFVLDAKRVIRYRGRVDDQYGVGIRFPEPQRHDLAIALDELLADKPITVPHTPAPGCLIGREKSVFEEGEVTWSNQIVRIMQERCQVCHRPGAIGPFALLDYEEAQGWAEMMQEVIHQRRMPPWHADPRYGEFANEMRMTDEEIALIDRWVADGAPEGDPAMLPEPREWPGEWPMGEPDEIIYMADQPYDVPAQGDAVYKYFFVDPGYTEGKWIKATWSQPGNLRVVHHINVYFKPPWQSWISWVGGTVNLVSGYLPGQIPPPIEFQGTAMYIPAGSEFVFEMHYTPNGTAQQDLSSVGLIYADDDEVTREALHVCAYNDQFVIPPHAENHRVEASYTFNEDAQLEFLNVHMHLRGKNFRFDATYPDGTKETWLNVVGYDYDWQTVYWLEDPLPIPEGTRVDCIAHYDNSANNPRNPDPGRTVRWSGYTWDEMMVGTLGISRDRPADEYLAGRDPDNPIDLPDYMTGQPGDELVDQAMFLNSRGDVPEAMAKFDAALSVYSEHGNWGGRIRVWITKLILLLDYYAGKLLVYVVIVSLAALALCLYDRWAAARGYWRPRMSLQLISLVGGSVVIFVMRYVLLRGRWQPAIGLRLLPVFALQFALAFGGMWLVAEYYH